MSLDMESKIPQSFLEADSSEKNDGIVISRI